MTASDCRAVEALLLFRDRLAGYGPERPFGRYGTAPNGESTYHAPPVLGEFLEALEAHGWLRGEYDQQEGMQFREASWQLRRADVATCRRLLLWCQRLDYWASWSPGEGWRDVIEDGFIPAILDRLATLHGEECGGLSV